MKKIIFTSLSVLLISFGYMYGTAESSSHLADETNSSKTTETSIPGNAERGKVLFNDTSLGNGSAQMSCTSCHPKGRGLEGSAEKTSFKVMGKNRGTLEDTVNFCIETALKGEALPLESQDMKDIVAYIKSLGK